MKRSITFALVLAATLETTLGQTRCDGRDLEDGIFQRVEHMPVASTAPAAIATLINQVAPVREPLNAANALVVTFIVNCKGEDFHYRVVRSVDSTQNAQVIAALSSRVRWSPGKLGERYVDVAVSLAFDLKDGLYVAYKPQESPKKSKRRRRRN